VKTIMSQIYHTPQFNVCVKVANVVKNVVNYPMVSANIRVEFTHDIKE